MQKFIETYGAYNIWQMPTSEFWACSHEPLNGISPLIGKDLADVKKQVQRVYASKKRLKELNMRVLYVRKPFLQGKEWALWVLIHDEYAGKYVQKIKSPVEKTLQYWYEMYNSQKAKTR